MRLFKNLMIVILAALFALAAAGCAGSSSDEVIGSDDSSTSAESDDPSDEGESDDAKPQDFTVQSGFTAGEDSINTMYTTAGALLTNPNSDAASYGAQVLFNVVSSKGDVLDSVTETVNYIGPGETVPVAPLQIGFDLKTKPTKLEVQVVGEFSDDEGPKDSFGSEMAILKVKSAKITASDYGQELDGQVTNPTDEIVKDATWDCVYLNGKKIVGGASSSIIDPIPPGSTVQFGDMISVDSLKVTDVQCRVTSSY